MSLCSGPSDRRVPAPAAALLLLLILARSSPAVAQTSFPLSDLMPRARGTALGGQALSGDLLAVGVDPAAAAGDHWRVQAGGGRDLYGLSYAAVGAAFQWQGHPLAITIGTLSYGAQARTDYADRLGVFGGEFTPGDASLSLAGILLDDGSLRVGIGLTASHARIADYDAAALAGALSLRQRSGAFELRAGVSDLGGVITRFESDSGTHLPARLRSGGAWTSDDGTLELSGELAFRTGEDLLIYGAGAEWRPDPRGALRFGITRGEGLDALADSGPGTIGITAGAGWRFSDWQVDYVLRPGVGLGAGHFLVLGWSPAAR